MKNLLIASLLIVGVSCHSHLFGTTKECNISIDCGRGTSHICVHGKCVELQPAQRTFYGIVGKDICPIRCPDGTRCVNGACQAFFGSSNSQQSFFGMKSCPIACPDGTRCVNGNCITKRFFGPKLCSTQIDCGSSEVCADGKCVVDNGHGGLCSSDAFCPDGFTCIDGKCSEVKRHFDVICTAPCLPGQKCVAGFCQSIPMFHHRFY